MDSLEQLFKQNVKQVNVNKELFLNKLNEELYQFIQKIYLMPEKDIQQDKISYQRIISTIINYENYHVFNQVQMFQRQFAQIIQILSQKLNEFYQFSLTNIIFVIQDAKEQQREILAYILFEQLKNKIGFLQSLQLLQINKIVGKSLNKSNLSQDVKVNLYRIMEIIVKEKVLDKSQQKELFNILYKNMYNEKDQMVINCLIKLYKKFFKTFPQFFLQNESFILQQFFISISIQKDRDQALSIFLTMLEQKVISQNDKCDTNDEEVKRKIMDQFNEYINNRTQLNNFTKLQLFFEISIKYQSFLSEQNMKYLCIRSLSLILQKETNCQKLYNLQLKFLQKLDIQQNIQQFKIYRDILKLESLKMECQQDYLITGLSIIIKQIGSRIFEIINDFNDLYNMITHLLESADLKIPLSKIICAFLSENQKYKAIVTSFLMNQVTLQYAQIEGERQSQEVFILTDQNNKILVNSLQANIYFILEILKTDQQQFNISMEINNSLFDISMRLIKKASQSLSGIDSMLVQLGYQLMAGLLSVTNQEYKINDYLQALQAHFTHITHHNNQYDFFNHFSCFPSSLSSILVFLKQCHKYHNTLIYKLFIHFLSLFTNNYLKQLTNQSTFLLEKHHQQILQAYLLLFQCYNHLPITLYTKSINTLLQIAITLFFDTYPVDIKPIVNKYITHIQDQLFLNIYYTSDLPILTARHKLHITLLLFIKTQFTTHHLLPSNKTHILTYLTDHLQTAIKQCSLILVQSYLLVILQAVQGLFASTQTPHQSSLSLLIIPCHHLNNPIINYLSAYLSAQLFTYYNTTNQLTNQMAILNNYKHSLQQSNKSNKEHTLDTHNLLTVSFILRTPNLPESILEVIQFYIQLASKTDHHQGLVWLSSQAALNLYWCNSINIINSCLLFIQIQVFTPHSFQYIYPLQTLLPLLQSPHLSSPIIINYANKLVTDTHQHLLSLSLSQHQTHTHYLTLLVLNLQSILITKYSQQALPKPSDILLNTCHLLTLHMDYKLQLLCIQFISSMIYSQPALQVHQLVMPLLTHYNHLMQDSTTLTRKLTLDLHNLYILVLQRSLTHNPLFYNHLLQVSTQLLFNHSCVIPLPPITDQQSSPSQPGALINTIQSPSNPQKGSPVRPATRTLVLTTIRQILTSLSLESLTLDNRITYVHTYLLFLFKIITSVDEQLREQGLQIFVKAFKRFKGIDENGVINGDKDTILLQFCVQIETILTVNLKTHITNYPSINMNVYKLVIQFHKLVKDERLINKQVGLLVAPLLTTVRLVLSANYSEYAHTSQHLSRLKVIPQLIINTNCDLTINEYVILQQQYMAVICDNLVLLAHKSHQVKAYHRLFSVYTGNTNSYSQTLHYKVFPVLLEFYLYLMAKLDNTQIQTDDLYNIITANKQILYKDKQCDILVLSALVFLLTSHEPMNLQRECQQQRAKNISDTQIAQIIKDKQPILVMLNQFLIMKVHTVLDYPKVLDSLKAILMLYTKVDQVEIVQSSIQICINLEKTVGQDVSELQDQLVNIQLFNVKKGKQVDLDQLLVLFENQLKTVEESKEKIQKIIMLNYVVNRNKIDYEFIIKLSQLLFKVIGNDEQAFKQFIRYCFQQKKNSQINLANIFISIQLFNQIAIKQEVINKNEIINYIDTFLMSEHQESQKVQIIIQLRMLWQKNKQLDNSLYYVLKFIKSINLNDNIVQNEIIKTIVLIMLLQNEEQRLQSFEYYLDFFLSCHHNLNEGNDDQTIQKAIIKLFSLIEINQVGQKLIKYNKEQKQYLKQLLQSSQQKTCNNNSNNSQETKLKSFKISQS